jgi:uncharacterized protein DUF4838
MSVNELTIVVPCNGGAKLWNVWAESESEIDFRNNQFEADRCTLCFAAFELKNFLCKIIPKLNLSIKESKPQNKAFIKLGFDRKDTMGGFTLIPSKNALSILGHDRSGLLNGVYEFLRMQGLRWIEPGKKGEYCPKRSELEWPEKEIDVTPSFKYRGIDAYRESQDSVEYMLWMARNRLNVCFRKAATGKFADKLGMLSRTGGHLLHHMLSPDRYLETGKTIWEEHPEWYGFPENGERLKKSATKVQLCISQGSLLDFISDELLKMLDGKLKDVDIVDIWGFDTWGAVCSCQGCQQAGNGSDHNLILLSTLRTKLDKAQRDGQLNRKVLLTTTAYEGTVTLDAPTKPLPENLKDSEDICLFYPIRRCYRHHFEDTTCDINQKYSKAWIEWNKKASRMSIWIGEYYNVSKFEDLPLLFMNKIPHDMRFYHASGGNGTTYMHAIFVNWAMRSLTQMQHAQYSWDINVNDEDFLSDYFESRYGRYAAAMRKAYTLIDKASADVSVWRNWKIGALSFLMAWDGTQPKTPLIFGHFQTPEDAIKAAEHSAKCYEKASGIIEGLVKAEQQENWKAIPAPDYAPVNPQELELFYSFDYMEYRLEESRRLIRYGLDAMRLLANLLKYHNALFNKKISDSDMIWENIESRAKKMSSYYVPISFEQPGSGLISKDALTRTQFRPLITRCRGARIKSLLKTFCLNV